MTNSILSYFVDTNLFSPVPSSETVRLVAMGKF